MKLNIIINLLCICLFFGLAQQIYGTNPKHFADNERNKQNVASSSNSVVKSQEENIKSLIKAILTKTFSPKMLNILKGKGKEKVPDECAKCPICYELVMIDQICFCDHLIGDAIFGSSSNNAQKGIAIKTKNAIVEANEQVEENNEEMEKNRKGKAIIEMIMSPKFSKIVGRKGKPIEPQTKDVDEQRVKKERIKQNVASSSKRLEKSHEESGDKKENRAIHKEIISPKILNVLKLKGKSKHSQEQQTDQNQKKKGIVEQNDIAEALKSPKNQSEFLSAPDNHSDKSHSYESTECLICCDYVTYDQLCFCDHLIGDAIFGSSSNNAQKESHAFCRECLNGYTKAALETKPFASGWLGLKCMAEKCENPIPWQEIKKHASPDELKAIETLESQCAELCVSAAGLCLERCPKCNYAVEMDCPISADCDNETNNNHISDGTKGICYCLLKLVIPILGAIYPIWLNDLFLHYYIDNEILKFHCPECHYEMCRKCNEKWAEEHNNLTCEQFAKQQRREKNLKDNKLSENVVNKFMKCPNCKIPIEKNGGCRHMTCRCCKFEFLYCCGNKYNPSLQKHALFCRRKFERRDN